MNARCTHKRIVENRHDSGSKRKGIRFKEVSRSDYASQITGVWKHVWMAGNHWIRDGNADEPPNGPGARSDRFTGNVPASGYHKPLYSDILRRL